MRKEVLDKINEILEMINNEEELVEVIEELLGKICGSEDAIINVYILGNSAYPTEGLPTMYFMDIDKNTIYIENEKDIEKIKEMIKKDIQEWQQQ